MTKFAIPSGVIDPGCCNYWQNWHSEWCCNRNTNRNLEISRAPTKAKSRELAYSQALCQIKTGVQGVKIRRGQAGRQADG